MVLMRKFDLDCEVLTDVMRRNLDFAKLATDMELEAREMLREEESIQ
jgi:hypothetical protein